MPGTVMKFSVSHNPINAQGTYTNGDFVSGQIRLNLAQDCHIKWLLVKLKGKADVWWNVGKNSHYSEEKVLSLTQYFIRKDQGEEERTDEGATEEELQWDDEVEAAPKVEKNKAPPEFDDDYLREAEKNLTEEEGESRRQESLALKEEGNSRFKAAEHRVAEYFYTEALGVCPVCFSSDRALLFSNRAAARIHLDLKDQAIADCSRAVELNPDNVRAILRRAELYEKTDKLDEALGDYKTVLEKEPGQNEAREACMRLPRQIHDRDENMDEDGCRLLTDEHGKLYSNKVACGCHVYPFTFQFPVDQEAWGLPPTFKGEVGEIRYTLEAYMSRPNIWMDDMDVTKLIFIPKAVINSELMTPQHDTKEKKMKLFTSGMVAMDVKVDKMGYCHGERINVVASIQNNSSRDIKPKYCLYSKQSFLAEGSRKLFTRDLIREVGDVIPPSCHQTVTRNITIRSHLIPSILNCNIIKVEYRLRVYLDVKYASDPHIKFPIVVMPAPGRQAVPRGPAAYGPQPAFEAPGGKPGFGAPGDQPAFGTPGAQLAFGGPGGPPSFAKCRPQPAFEAPGTPPAFGASGSPPGFGASGGPPASEAPSGQPPALSNPTQSGDASPPPYGSYGMYPTSSENFL